MGFDRRLVANTERAQRRGEAASAAARARRNPHDPALAAEADRLRALYHAADLVDHARKAAALLMPLDDEQRAALVAAVGSAILVGEAA